MNNRHQKRRKLTPGTEMLESRELLNGHFPHHSFVHVAQVSPHSAGQIKGTLTGQSPYIGQSTSNNVYVGIDTYTASGNTNRGSATVTGQDSDNSELINPTTYSNTYYGGNWNLTLSNGSSLAVAYVGIPWHVHDGQVLLFNGSSLAVAYVGSGPSPVALGHYSERFTGEAIGTSGALAGHMYSFTAKVTGDITAINGNNEQSTVTIKFTLKG
jgi:hypothetical protein